MRGGIASLSTRPAHRTPGRRAAALGLIALLALALVPVGTVHASEPMPPPGQVWTVYNRVEATVHDNYARVKVIAEIGNRGPDPEFPFQVRVPADAFVTGLTIERDGVVYEAVVKEREAARAQYDDWKRQEETGGLVEKQRGSEVVAFLVNVAEFTSVTATLTYETYLAAHEGVFDLPLEAPVSGFGQDLGARFDVVVSHGDGVDAAWGWQPTGEPPYEATARTGEAVRSHFVEDGAHRVSHSVGPRPDDASTPFVVSYQLSPTADEGSLAATVFNGTGYFAHRFRAPADALELPLDLTLVLDVSGSMGGLKIDQLQDAATQVLARLTSEDRIHLVLFSSDARSPWRGLANATPDQRQRAIEEVEHLFAGGGTNIEAAISEGFDAFEGVDWTAAEGRLPLLVFLTDGQPSTGLQDRGALRAAARAANENDVRVFALAFGEDADWGLVHGLAADGGGTALRVASGHGAEVDLRRFMAALTTPVLRDLTIAYDGAVSPYGNHVDVLFSGSELLVVGTFDPKLDRIEGTVTARAADGTRTYSFSEDVAAADRAAFLPRLVAYQEVRRLQALLDAGEGADEDVERIVELALANGFVTDHTSLVVTLEPRELRPFDPDARGGWSDDAAMDPRGQPPPSSPAPSGSSGSATTDLVTRYDTSDGAEGEVDQDQHQRVFERLNESPEEAPLAPVLALVALLGAALVARRRER